LGLMGGSLALAAREKGVAREVCGYARRESTRVSAIEGGVVDRACATLEEAVAGAQLVVFCVPILATAPLVRRCSAHVAAGAVVTDVGSTKKQLMADLQGVLPRGSGTFVGSHPMAGSEETGLDAARSDLYEGSLVIVTPGDGDVPWGASSSVKRTCSLWEALGAKVEIMRAGLHDEAVARTSHLPHLVAALLVGSVCREGVEGLCRFCGTGFHDTTRIAGGSEDVWHDIVRTNRGAVKAELDAFQKELAGLQQLLEIEDYEGVRQFLAQCRRKRLGCLSES